MSINSRLIVSRLKNESFFIAKFVSTICLLYFILFFAYLNFFFEFDSNNSEKIQSVKFKNSNLTNSTSINYNECFLQNDYCFNQCPSRSHLKVFIYSNSDKITAHIMSKQFGEFIETITQSIYYEADPNKACIYIPLIDLFNSNNQLGFRQLESLDL
jgi:hypothetical protein